MPFQHRPPHCVSRSKTRPPSRDAALPSHRTVPSYGRGQCPSLQHSNMAWPAPSSSASACEMGPSVRRANSRRGVEDASARALVPEFYSWAQEYVTVDLRLSPWPPVGRPNAKSARLNLRGPTRILKSLPCQRPSDTQLGLLSNKLFGQGRLVQDHCIVCYAATGGHWAVLCTPARWHGTKIQILSLG